MGRLQVYEGKSFRSEVWCWVKAATYIELPGAGSAAPPEEIIDFVLNRPFLFVITNDKLPLFAGCVNNPEN